MQNSKMKWKTYVLVWKNEDDDRNLFLDHPVYMNLSSKNSQEKIKIDVSEHFHKKINMTWLLGEVHTFLESSCIKDVVHETYLEFYAEFKNEIKSIRSKKQTNKHTT
jgi:hypothetical protein